MTYPQMGKDRVGFAKEVYKFTSTKYNVSYGTLVKTSHSKPSYVGYSTSNSGKEYE